MAANVRLGYLTKDWDLGTPSASSEASSQLGAANALHDEVGRPWRSGSAASQWWQIDLGSGKQITGLILGAANWTSAATIAHKSNTIASWSSPPREEVLGVVTDVDGEVYRHLVVFFDVSHQYHRIEIDDPTNPDGYIEVGYIRGFRYWEPSRNYAKAWEMPYVDPSEPAENEPGKSTSWHVLEPYRRAAIRFDWQTGETADQLEAFFRNRGNHKPLILALHPDTRPIQDTMYCRMTTPLGKARQGVKNFTSGVLEFVEETR